MKPQIQFLKMDRSEAVENFVLNEISKIHVWGTHSPHYRIWLECEKTKVDPGGPIFRTAIEVDGLRGNKSIFVEKTDTDFYQSFNKVMAALETIFRREKGTLRNRQRKQLKRLKDEFFTEHASATALKAI